MIVNFIPDFLDEFLRNVVITPAVTVHIRMN